MKKISVSLSLLFLALFSTSCNDDALNEVDAPPECTIAEIGIEYIRANSDTFALAPKRFSYNSSTKVFSYIYEQINQQIDIYFNNGLIESINFYSLVANEKKITAARKIIYDNGRMIRSTYERYHNDPAAIAFTTDSVILRETIDYTFQDNKIAFGASILENRGTISERRITFDYDSRGNMTAVRYWSIQSSGDDYVFLEKLYDYDNSTNIAFSLESRTKGVPGGSYDFFHYSNIPILYLSPNNVLSRNTVEYYPDGTVAAEVSFTYLYDFDEDDRIIGYTVLGSDGRSWNYDLQYECQEP